MLTAALARRAGRVLAVELDADWARRLLDRFADTSASKRSVEEWIRLFGGARLP